MSRVSIWLAAIAIGIVTWGLSIPALAAEDEAQESLSCPEGYSLQGDVCINANGDVVEPK